MTAKDVSALKEIATRSFASWGARARYSRRPMLDHQSLQLAVQKEAAVAYQQHEEAKTEVRKRLRHRIRRRRRDSCIPGTILPGSLFAHPDVVAAK